MWLSDIVGYIVVAHLQRKGEGMRCESTAAAQEDASKKYQSNYEDP